MRLVLFTPRSIEENESKFNRGELFVESKETKYGVA